MNIKRTVVPTTATIISLITLAIGARAQIYQGTISLNATPIVAGGSLTGTVDYQIDLSTDTMTLSNKTGDFLNSSYVGLSQTTVLYAMNDFTSAAPDIDFSGGPTFDVTASTTNLLAMGGADGWYWSALPNTDTFSGHPNMMIGGWGGVFSSPVQDSPFQGNIGSSDWGGFVQTVTPPSGNYTTTSIGINGVDFGTPTLVPEPSSSILLVLGGLSLTLRRNKKSQK